MNRDLVDELRRREEWFLLPEARHAREELAAVIADDFAEIGRAGRLYDKASAIAALLAEPAPDASSPTRTIHDFQARELAPDVVQVMFRLVVDLGRGGPPSESRRTSIWVRRDARWKILYHQGTRCEAS